MKVAEVAPVVGAQYDKTVDTSKLASVRASMDICSGASLNEVRSQGMSITRGRTWFHWYSRTCEGRTP